MSVLVALLWFATPLVLCLAYLWASRRLPLPLWAGVLGSLNILAIIVIALPAAESLAGGHRGDNALATLVAAVLLIAPAAGCWLAWRWLRAERARASRRALDAGVRTALPAGHESNESEIARLRRITALQERARRDGSGIRRRPPARATHPATGKSPSRAGHESGPASEAGQGTGASRRLNTSPTDSV
jgi:hypothetical protein